MIIENREDGGITISDNTKIYTIKAKLIFKRDSGHGGGSYVNGVKLLVWETSKALDEENHRKREDKFEAYAG